jgi:hypothetical protein
MTLTQLSPWAPALIAAACASGAMVLRSLVLLIGLLVTLPRLPPRDRAGAFREFARATVSRSPLRPPAGPGRPRRSSGPAAR